MNTEKKVYIFEYLDGYRFLQEAWSIEHAIEEAGIPDNISWEVITRKGERIILLEEGSDNPADYL